MRLGFECRLLPLLLLVLTQFSTVAVAAEVDKCSVCGRLTEAFQAGLIRTAKDNFGGGNTHWEESRLGSYAHSETRLVDIQERLCEGEGKDDTVACHALVEKFEEAIESWWFGEFRSGTSTPAALRDLLCVQRAPLCCSLGAYGPNCADCPACAPTGGSCDGNGTRGGSGVCKCQSGYRGALCNECADGHYSAAAVGGSSFTNCLPCHAACGPGGCSGGATNANCRDCAPGYKPASDGAAASEGLVTCVDVDECSADSGDSSPPCAGPHERCVNSPGSFACECAPGHRREADGGKCAPESAGDSAEKGASDSAETGGDSAETGDGDSAETDDVDSTKLDESAEAPAESKDEL